MVIHVNISFFALRTILIATTGFATINTVFASWIRVLFYVFVCTGRASFFLNFINSFLDKNEFFENGKKKKIKIKLN
jgi:hypothetical protein